MIDAVVSIISFAERLSSPGRSLRCSVLLAGQCATQTKGISTTSMDTSAVRSKNRLCSVLRTAAQITQIIPESPDSIAQTSVPSRLGSAIPSAISHNPVRSFIETHFHHNKQKLEDLQTDLSRFAALCLLVLQRRILS